MRKFTSIIALVLLIPMLSPAQTKYTIVVLGSSTAAGTGASAPDSSWVNRTKAYYKSQGVLDTLINLAAGGSYSDSGVKLLPKAMSYYPDIVIVGFPSNDIIADVPIHKYVNNLRTMYNTVTAAGKKCFVTTTQPRNDPKEHMLRIGRDSIENAFPAAYVLDFYDPLVSPASDDINPLYTAEGLHPNNAGHRLLFETAVAAGVIPLNPLPIHLIDFTGARTDHGVKLSWTASSTDDNTDFVVERSADGISYQDISNIPALSDGTAKKYSFIDENPLSTNSYYRLKTVSNGAHVSFSNTIPFEAITAAFAIKGFYVTDGRRAITTTIGIQKDQIVRLSIFTTSGTAVKQQSYAVKAPFTTLDVPLPALSAGLYILQLTTADGQRIVRSFPVLR